MLPAVSLDFHGPLPAEAFTDFIDDQELTKFQHEQQLAVMQEDVDALEAQEIMYATDPGGTAESSIRSDLAALRGRRAVAKMLTREQQAAGTRPRASA